MNRFCKLICLGAAVMVSSGGFADSSDVSQSNQKQTQRMSNGKKPQNAPAFEQGMGLPANKYPAAYNAPACISLKNSWDFDIFGSFIYWHASQDLMDIAYVPTLANPTPATSVSGAVAFQHVNYKPGFKVGFGFKTDHDAWVFRAEYTWLHQTVSSSITAPLLPTGAPGSWSSNNWFTSPGAENEGAAVSSSWKLKIDMVDAVMQRPFYEGTMLTVTPYGGMRALWLRQQMNINLLDSVGDINAYSNNRSNSWSIGPTTGVGGHWILGAGFRFEGNAGASILYTRYTKIAHNEQDVPLREGPSVLPTSASTRNMNTLRPVGQLAVGLGWGTYCCDTEFYFDISLDYEFLYLWDQNVMREWTGMLTSAPSVSGDLQIHGLTATFRFDF